jgi:hypothetical protein
LSRQDTVWFSPICKSPLEDNLYDISDYKAIHEPFGTLEDVDRLIKELHARDMKVRPRPAACTPLATPLTICLADGL